MAKKDQRLVMKRYTDRKDKVRFWVYLSLPKTNLSKVVTDHIDGMAKSSGRCSKQPNYAWPGYSFTDDRFHEACRFAMAVSGFMKLKIQYVDG